jgi:hypothetical protein
VAAAIAAGAAQFAIALCRNAAQRDALLRRLARAVIGEALALPVAAILLSLELASSECHDSGGQKCNQRRFHGQISSPKHVERNLVGMDKR